MLLFSIAIPCIRYSVCCVPLMGSRFCLDLRLPALSIVDHSKQGGGRSILSLMGRCIKGSGILLPTGKGFILLSRRLPYVSRQCMA